MSIRTRTLVFATFFGSSLVVGLLLASLTTEHWIHADAKRHNATESFGRIKYGLFTGTKELNVGYGMRSNPVQVTALMGDGNNIMSFWLWLGAALGTGFALFSSAVGAIASVLKAASESKKPSIMIFLFVANFSSAISQILAFVCWLVQFYIYLTHNVLIVEDQKLHWYSRGLASLGYSFYFVVASTIVVLINIIILIVAYKHENCERWRLAPQSDEKNNSAIMLY